MGGTLSESSPYQPGWSLIARVRVPADAKVRCQCDGCVKSVYADIHMVRLGDGRFQCWGSECYRRLVTGLAADQRPDVLYPHVNGRELTEEERVLLLQRTEALAKQFQAEYERAEAEKAAEVFPERPPKPTAMWTTSHRAARYGKPAFDPDLPDASGKTPQDRINDFAIELGRRKREQRMKNRHGW